MRIRRAVFTLLIAGACGAKTAAPAPVGNAGGAPPRNITVTAVDSTSGGHEDAIQATADAHVAMLAHAQDGGALALTVTLMSVEFDPNVGIACRARILVTTAGNDAIVASFEGAAEVAGPDPGAQTTDCIDGLVGNLIDTHVAQLVDARAGP